MFYITRTEGVSSPNEERKKRGENNSLAARRGRDSYILGRRDIEQMQQQPRKERKRKK